MVALSVFIMATLEIKKKDPFGGGNVFKQYG